METINIFLSREKVSKGATTKQIKFLLKLIKEDDEEIDLPFTSLQEAKKQLRSHEASRAINELKERGNSIKFIYPKD